MGRRGARSKRAATSVGQSGTAGHVKSAQGSTQKRAEQFARTSAFLGDVNALIRHSKNMRYIGATDKAGRSVFHIAASSPSGFECLQWLVEHHVAPDLLNAKDKENGWTPLHRAMYHGHLKSALLLLQHGASLSTVDSEDFTPLDLVRLDADIAGNSMDLLTNGSKGSAVVMDPDDKDEIPTKEDSSRNAISSSDADDEQACPEDYTVFSWGSNGNFTLGHGDGNSRERPQRVLLTGKEGNVPIDLITTNKFHTVFVTPSGTAFTCGFGREGRLGLGDEESRLDPAPIPRLRDIPCKAVAAGRDHTLFVSEWGALYACGSNLHGQLGVASIDQALEPVKLRSLKGEHVIGVAAGNYHSIAFTHSCVFAFGLNQGQLGLPKTSNNEAIQGVPRKVALLGKYRIQVVSTCDTMTICVTNDGEAVLLYDYTARVIRLPGYNTLYSSDPMRSLKEIVAADVSSLGSVYVVSQSGHLYYYENKECKRCKFLVKHAVAVQDVSLTTRESNGSVQLLVTTVDGQVLLGTPKKKDKTLILCKRVPLLHQINFAVCDNEGRHYFAIRQSARKQTGTEDFFAIQDESASGNEEAVDLNETLSSIGNDGDEEEEEEEEEDGTTNKQEFFHRGTSGSVKVSVNTVVDDLSTIWETEENGHDIVIVMKDGQLFAHRAILMFTPYFEKALKRRSAEEMKFLHFPKICMEIALSFMYGRQCAKEDLVRLGVDLLEKTIKLVEELQLTPLTTPLRKIRSHLIEVKETRAEEAKLREEQWKANIIAVPQEKFIPEPDVDIERKDIALRCLLPKPKTEDDLRFYDVKLVSGSNFLMCHRFVLASRCEYFAARLASRWTKGENGSKQLELDFPFVFTSKQLLWLVVEYLYTGDADLSQLSLYELFELIVASNGCLMTRLEEICELEISRRVNCSNFAAVVESTNVVKVGEQILEFCAHYACRNLEHLFELRLFEGLHKEFLARVDTVWKKTLPPARKFTMTIRTDDGGSGRSNSLSGKEGRQLRRELAKPAREHFRNMGFGDFQITKALETTGIDPESSDRVDISMLLTYILNHPEDAEKEEKRDAKEGPQLGDGGDESSASDDAKDAPPKDTFYILRQPAVKQEDDVSVHPASVGVGYRKQDSKEDQWSKAGGRKGKKAAKREKQRQLQLQKEQEEVLKQRQQHNRWDVLPSAKPPSPISLSGSTSSLASSAASSPWKSPQPKLLASPRPATVSLPFPPLGGNEPNTISLRDIIQTEEKASKTAAPLPTSRGKSPTKKSQRERRLLQQEQLALSRSPKDPELPGMLGKSPSNDAPWGLKASQSKKMSFMEAQMRDQIDQSKRQPLTMSTPEPMAASPGRLWNAHAPSSSPKVSLMDIMMDEKAAKSAKTKVMNKSLAAIQIEETAVKQLEDLYNVTDNPDEFVRIYRIAV